MEKKNETSGQRIENNRMRRWRRTENNINEKEEEGKAIETRRRRRENNRNEEAEEERKTIETRKRRRENNRNEEEKGK